MVYVITNNKIHDSKLYLNLDKKNLHNSLKFFIVFLQILGFLPVTNTTKSNMELKFRWKSFLVLYTIILITLTYFALITCFYAWSDYGYVFTDLVTYVFYLVSAVTLILHLRLAKRWSILMKSWCDMDKYMNRIYGYPPYLDKRLRVCSFVFLSLAILDYIMSSVLRYNNMIIKYGDQYDYKNFFNETFPQLYLVLPINGFTATYCAFLNFHASLVQASNDLFIILMSIALALRFKQITQKLEKSQLKLQIKSQEFWIEIREDYDRLSMLCKQLDDNISYVVLMSYTTNLFFLLVQLYQSLEDVSGVMGTIYFVFSFVHIIFKIVCVSLYAAWINDESIEPANILNSVSSASYNIEVKRLLMQIGFDNVALTGCRMFKITRGIILSIAGAVVTYELVLIQFNSATAAKIKIN